MSPVLDNLNNILIKETTLLSSDYDCNTNSDRNDLLQEEKKNKAQTLNTIVDKYTAKDKFISPSILDNLSHFFSLYNFLIINKPKISETIFWDKKIDAAKIESWSLLEAILTSLYSAGNRCTKFITTKYKENIALEDLCFLTRFRKTRNILIEHNDNPWLTKKYSEISIRPYWGGVINTDGVIDIDISIPQEDDLVRQKLDFKWDLIRVKHFLLEAHRYIE